MSRGLSNSLTKQIGEHLVCAELGKRNLIATPFAGNVPAFDILAADEFCRTVPIQVKASRFDNWPSDARYWMNITLNPQTQVQKNCGEIAIQNPTLIYVCVAIAPLSGGKDRFFILTKAQLQVACIKAYSAWMNGHNWRRPKNPASYDCRYRICNVKGYEDNWQLILDRLATSSPDQPLESTQE